MPAAWFSFAASLTKSSLMSKAVTKVANVGIVYSESEHLSNESKNLAFYLCGLLSLQGHSNVYLVGFRQDGQPGDVSHKRISYIPRNKTKPVEVPASDVNFSHWDSLNNCHLVIVTVNSKDTEPCAKKLHDLISTRKSIAIFSLQRGVRNSNVVKEEIGSNGNIAIVEGVVAFAVVLDAKYSAYIATTQYPALMFERLSREAVKVADGPMNLLETMELDFSFRKTLTPFSWGVLLYENLYALNALTRGSLNDTLGQRSWRLILAFMVRESNKTLSIASRGGAWKPDLLLLTTMLSPWLLELLLVLPTPLFVPIFWSLGLYFKPQLISPGQLDLSEGRRSMAADHLSEIVEAGKRNNYPCQVCSLVLDKLRLIENGLDRTNTTLPSVSYSADHMSALESEVRAIMAAKGHASVSELWFWVVRGLAVLSALLLVVFLFLHDY